MSKLTISLRGVHLNYPLLGHGLSRLGNSLKSAFNVGNISHYPALKNINLDIKKGETIGIIGNNGSGKSTLLRVIAGIYQPDIGESLVSRSAFLLAGIGTGFADDLTGRRNVYLYGSVLGFNKKIMDQYMDEIIEFTELDEFIDLPLKTYSTGMKARLGFAVASTVCPEIFLIDEVLSVGDSNFNAKSSKRIEEMVNGAGTVVIVSHSLGYIQQVCDRVILMEKGEIIADGTPEEVIAIYYKKPIEISDDLGNKTTLKSSVQGGELIRTVSESGNSYYAQYKILGRYSGPISYIAFELKGDDLENYNVDNLDLESLPEHNWDDWKSVILTFGESKEIMDKKGKFWDLWENTELDVKKSLPIEEEVFSKKWYKRYIYEGVADLMRRATFLNDNDSLEKLKSLDFWENLE